MKLDGPDEGDVDGEEGDVGDVSEGPRKSRSVYTLFN